MLQLAQRTCAPSAWSVSIRTAVWIVMCKLPAMRAPLSGWLAAYFLRIAMRPGISCSAMAISLRPQSAKLKSATTYSGVALELDWEGAFLVAVAIEFALRERMRSFQA